MSRVHPGHGIGIPRASVGSSKSGTDWLLVSSLSMTFGIILFVFCSVIMPRAKERAQYARISAAHHDLSVLANAVRNFRLDCDRYPSTDDGLQALRTPPIDSHGWNGPYVDAIPHDPWHHAYQYESPGPSGAGFEIESHGADTASGDSGPDSDIKIDEDGT